MSLSDTGVVKRGPLRWGLFGAGRICHDFAEAIKLLPKTEHQLAAVAARDLRRSCEFAQQHGVRRCYGRYEVLAKDDDVDVIYIGTVNSEHYEQVKLAIEHGKNVLCEKSLCLNAKQAKELVRLARENGVFLMEGLWTKFFPAFKKLEEELQNKSIGEVQNILIATGTNSWHTNRISSKELGGGAFMNVGIYGIHMALHIFGSKPDQIQSCAQLGDTGVDKHFVTNLLYNDGRSATLIANVTCQMPIQFSISGSNGMLKLPRPYYCPTTLETTNNGTFHFDLPKVGPNTYFNYPNGQGFVYEAEEVRRCLHAGLLESPFMTLQTSVAVLEIADAIRKEIGIQFQADFDA